MVTFSLYIMGKDYLSILLRSENTVFTFKDVSLLWGEVDAERARKRIYRYVKSGKLYAVRRGIYAKEKSYDRLELAVKIYTPSYISFETVLAKAGIIFQFYAQIFAASYLTREITADKQAYSYRKIKDAILTDDTGVEKRDNYAVASVERAFLDLLYLNKDYYFDNLTPLDRNKIFEILPVYKNKRMEKKVKEYRGLFQKSGK